MKFPNYMSNKVMKKITERLYKSTQFLQDKHLMVVLDSYECYYRTLLLNIGFNRELLE